jgi:hypothetical protein
LAACKGRAFEDLRDEAIIRVMFDTGARLGELAGIQLDDWDTRQDFLFVDGKSGPRLVPMSASTAEAVARYVRRPTWVDLGRRFLSNVDSPTLRSRPLSVDPPVTELGKDGRMGRRAPDRQEFRADPAGAVGHPGAAGGPPGYGDPAGSGDETTPPVGARWRRAVRAMLPVAVVVVVVGVPLARIARIALSTPGSIWLGVDVPQMELRTLAASRGHLLLGSFSQYGWQHPGPTLYYWYAPFYAASGRQPAGMIVGAVTANVIALAALVACVGRAGGRRAMWVAAAIVVAFVWRFGLTGLWVSWNPNLTVVPTALLIVATAALVCGRRWMLPAVVLLASWTVQAHLGTTLVVGGLCALAAVGGWVASRRDRRAWLVPAIAAAGVALVLWAAPAADEIAGSHNMRTVASYMVHNRLGPGASSLAGHRGPAFGHRQAVEEVGLVGSLLSGHEPGMIAGPDRFYIVGIGTSAALAVAFALLVLADAALAVACHRRGLRFPAALGGTVVLASLLAYASAFTARGNPSHHVLAFAAGIGLAAWLALALAAVELVAARRRAATPSTSAQPGPTSRRLGLPWRIGAGACLVAAVAAVTVGLDRRPYILINAHTPDQAVTLAAIDARPGERIVLDGDLNSGGVVLWGAVRLAEDDRDVRLGDRWAWMASPEQATPDSWDRTIYFADGASPPSGASWRRIGSLTLGPDRTVTIFSRPGPGVPGRPSVVGRRVDVDAVVVRARALAARVAVRLPRRAVRSFCFGARTRTTSPGK